MNDDDSDLFSWATDDEDANHELTSQSAAIRDAAWPDPERSLQITFVTTTHHLRALIENVRLGNTVESHDDVPPGVRDLLYAEEEQSIQRKRKRRSLSTDARPVNITSVMPIRAGHSSDDNGVRTPSESVEGSSYALKYLGIPGMRDVNVNNYCIWHCFKNANNVWKMEYKKVCDLTLAEGLDLEQIHLDQDAQFFIDKGIKKGIAKCWVSDVEVWFRDMETLEASE
ncbi:hypothetical protein FGLOB1_14479 [Fusarium globosum]|uniref:Uncharacterized protein n=1 Tax=Fusarium globosum TaxID=78864 RepID=A0A8H6CTT8_9HYPO|nr:hypothetical protein FGLOB1_14479 [Fusarium globosum]